MSAPGGFERRLTAWLDDQAATREPDGLLDAVTADLTRSGRVPGWAIPERWLPMQTRARLGTLPRAAIILVTLGLLAALLASIALGAGSSPGPTLLLPEPWGPAGNGLIAYDAGGDIWVMKPDGRDKQQLTSGPQVDYEPSWAPDGQHLAFWSFDKPGAQQSSVLDPALLAVPPTLVIVDARGGERRTVPVEGLLDQSYGTPPSWAPDSRQLVYGYTGLNGQREVMDIVSLDDLTPRRLGPGASPVWSPQGDWIAYRQGVPTGVAIIHPDGTNPHQVTKVGGSGYAFTSPQWSMDEQYLTFYAKNDGNHDVWVARADGSGEWPIGDEASEEYWPSFSPDGTRVAFQRDLPGQSLAFNYVVTDPEGSNAVDVASPALLPGLPGVWAPDGSRLLGLHKTDETAAGTVELYQVDAAGVAEPVVIPIDTDWVNVSWQRVAP